jgi:hypothetical protein
MNTTLPTTIATTIPSTNPTGISTGISIGNLRRLALGGLLALTPLTLAACGNDAAATDGVDNGVLTVDLADFTFGDLPDQVPAGTRLAVTSASTTELHELVAIRLADGDTRPAGDIIDAGLADVLAAGPPAAVLLAAPGGEQIPAVGDGTLSEPGRYLILCAIPTGADPGEYLAAAQANPDAGPPEVDGGAPHFAHGMFDDLVVTAG